MSAITIPEKSKTLIEKIVKKKDTLISLMTYISISITITVTAKMLTRLLLTGEKHNSVFLDKNVNLLE